MATENDHTQMGPLSHENHDIGFSSHVVPEPKDSSTSSRSDCCNLHAKANRNSKRTTKREVMDVKTPHALVIPMPVQGHVIPFMELSYCLLDHGFRITFVNSEFNHDRVVAATPKMNGEDQRIRLVSITDGMAPGEDRNDIINLCHGIREEMPRALEGLIVSINESGDDDSKITCIIADVSMGWALSLARKMGIPSAAFWPASVSCLAVIFQIPSMIRDDILSANGTVAKHGMIKLSPAMPEMDTAHFFWLCFDDPHLQQTLFRYILSNDNQDLKDTEWILCNSFYDIEQSACELIGSTLLPIGPLIAGRRHGHLEGNFWREDFTCLRWLDKQTAGSVIYVAFGSSTFFNQHQFEELALGLEVSGKPFLWVVRPDLTDGSERAYPDGFMERVAERGQIVAWSPQQKVLAHPAIACFFSHCGWNSTMEGVSNGVPFLCWPYNSDQFLNMDRITNVWKVGLGLKRESNGIVAREEIKRKLEDLLGSKEIRERSLELKELARKNISEGGSSWKNLNNFIEAMKSKSC